MKRIKDLIKKIGEIPGKYKIIGVIAILVVLFFVFRGRSKPTPLQTATVRRNSIQSQVSASGILSGKEVASLHFNQPGKLNYLAISTGDSVNKWETIAALDSTQLNSILQQALNTRRNTQATVDSIHDQLKGNDGNETFAQKATRTAAEVANDNAYDAVKAAQRALTDVNLVSPISGVVVAQDHITVGQNVGINDLVAQIVDFSQKRFEATVDESDIGNVKVGQDAIVTLNAYGDTKFKGVVTDISSETKTDSTGAITVTVKIELTDPKIQNIYGLNGNATIITNSKQNVLTIPQDGLIDDTHVYVKLPNGKTEKRTITTGIKSDTDTEVTSGLTEGEQVVTNPSAVK